MRTTITGADALAQGLSSWNPAAYEICLGRFHWWWGL